MRECQKLWGGCVFCTVLIRGVKPPLITSISNLQASLEFSTLPQVIPTSIAIPIPHKSTFLPFHFSSDTEFRHNAGANCDHSYRHHLQMTSAEIAFSVNQIIERSKGRMFDYLNIPTFEQHQNGFCSY